MEDKRRSVKKSRWVYCCCCFFSKVPPTPESTLSSLSHLIAEKPSPNEQPEKPVAVFPNPLDPEHYEISAPIPVGSTQIKS